MISIVVPVFNGSKFIKTFYKSCLNQSYKNFEIIFVDDGSTDETFNIIQKLKINTSLSIILVKQRNKGVSAARNVGIKRANGDLLCFCDIDDEISTDYLEELFRTYQIYKADLVISKMKFIRNEKIVDYENNSSVQKIRILNKIESLNYFLYGKFKTGVCTILVSKTTFLKNQIWFPSGYNYNEDLYVIWKLLSVSNKIVLLDKALYFYKYNINSAMNKFDLKRLDGYEIMKSLEEYFKHFEPIFYQRYKKHGVAKIAWSISWQAAIFLDFLSFKRLVDENKFRKIVSRLWAYPNLFVSLSSIILLFNLRLFYFFSRIFKSHRYRS